MGLPKLKTKISVEEYLKGEKISPVRHEYIEGEVYAMAGTSDNHSRIAGNIYVALQFICGIRRVNHLRVKQRFRSRETSTIIPTFWFRAKKIPKVHIFATHRF